MSLRARLLISLLLLVVAGLLTAGVATYRALSSFLVERVDQQLSVATQQATRVMTAPNDFQPPADRPPDGGALFPAGTYSALLDEHGNVEEEVVFGFSQDVPSRPDLPEELPGSATEQQAGVTFEVGSENGDATYRVRAMRLEAGTVVVAIPMTDVEDTLGRLLVIEVIVTLAVLAALVALTWWLVRLGFRPLERIGETAGAIAAGDLSRRVEPATERTEVGRLGLALNAMLARIEDSFAERRASEERLRRFVADASHELRTPLTSVRGYAELFRRGAADRPEDLGNAMDRIEEEGRRMADIVDELALLARLDQGRPLEREPADLVGLAAAGIDAARVTYPTHPIDLDAPEPVVAAVDPARFRQIIDNLLSNAGTHTPPGSAIHVHVHTDHDDAVLRVEDKGPGIPEEDAERVFERFYRADPSRSRESGGSGLGLSIVAAVAEAHGGSARYEHAPGGGARFEVRIPLDGLDVGIDANSA